MKIPAVLMVAVLSASLWGAPARAQILETAGIYSKAGAFGAGLGAAVSASMKNLGNPIKPMTPQQRTEAQQTNQILINTAQQEEKQGHHKRAVEVYKKMGTWRQTVFGEQDKAAQAAYVKAGDIAMSQKDYPQAEDNYRHALSGAVKCYGPGTPELIPFLGKLVSVTLAEKSFRDAETFASEVVALSEHEFGAKDPRAKAAKQQLYSVLQSYAQELTRDNRTEELQVIQNKMAAIDPASASASGDKPPAPKSP